MDLVVQSPDELLAAVPHVLGFKPEESIVLVPFRPGLPITRVDLPRTAADREEVWDALSGPYGRHARPGARLAIICITEDRRSAELASQHLSNRLQDVGITTHIRLWSDGERWREFNTGQTGLQTPSTAERIAAATVLTGAAQPAASRESLAASMVGDREPIAQLLPAARAAAADSPPALERDWALDRLEQFHADGNRLSDVDGARMLVALETISTRDALWEDLDRPHPPRPGRGPRGAGLHARLRQLAARRRRQGLVRARPGARRPALLHGRHRRLGLAERHPPPRVGAIPDPDARHRRRPRRVLRPQATRPAARHPGHAARHRPPDPGPLRRTPMNHDDDTPVQHSATERQLRRLVVPEPAAYAADKRLDVIHEPDLDLLWGGQE